MKELNRSNDMAARRQFPLAHLMWRSRRRMNCTLDEMARYTGLCKSSLWEMENSVQKNPRHTTLAAVCREYGFPISDVLPPRQPRQRKSQ